MLCKVPDWLVGSAVGFISLWEGCYRLFVLGCLSLCVRGFIVSVGFTGFRGCLEALGILWTGTSSGNALAQVLCGDATAGGTSFAIPTGIQLLNPKLLNP